MTSLQIEFFIPLCTLKSNKNKEKEVYQSY